MELDSRRLSVMPLARERSGQLDEIANRMLKLLAPDGESDG